MADVKWIKIVTDIFDDDKILLIENLPDADSLIVIWFKLLCIAGKQNNGGVFLLNNRIPYTDEMLSTIFRRPLNTVRMALNAFENYGMIELIDGVITIPNWEKHQSLDALEKKRERDRKYQQIHRENIKLLAKSSDTSSDMSSDVSGTDKNRIDKNRIDTVSLCDEKFNEFWSEYPRKDNKTTARKVYKKAMKSGDISEAILYGLRKYKQSEQWNRDGGKYIPMAATWLNQCRWEDYADQQEPEPKPPEPRPAWRDQ